ncbi:hypothetical protein IW262DRAFT_1386790 [Armillaria fumosa]|nr:hypothetical protein IW262DRAFT_1386790 [Armillaria fumosa]
MRSRDIAKFALIFPTHSHEFSRRRQYPADGAFVFMIVPRRSYISTLERLPRRCGAFNSRADIAGILPQRMMRHEGEMKSWRSPFSLSVYKTLCSKDGFCRNTNLTVQQCLLTTASHSREPWMLISNRFTVGTSGLNNYLQGKNRLDAVSWVEARSGPPNDPTWTMKCKIDGKVLGIGTGSQKHVAKDAASNQALASLKRQ